MIPLGGRRPEEDNPFVRPSGSGSAGLGIPPYYTGHPVGTPGSGIPGSGGYEGVKGGGLHPGVPPHGGNTDGSYPAGGVQGGAGPLQCKLGLFGCGTPGSGSYATTKGGKHPVGTFGGGIGGNVGTAGGAPGGGIGIGTASGSYAGGFSGSAGYPGSTSGSPAGSVGAGAPSVGQAGAYAGAFSSAQASSSSFADAKSLSFATGGAAGSYLARNVYALKSSPSLEIRGFGLNVIFVILACAEIRVSDSRRTYVNHKSKIKDAFVIPGVYIYSAAGARCQVDHTHSWKFSHGWHNVPAK